MTNKLFGPRRVALIVVGIALLMASLILNLGSILSALGIVLVLAAIGASLWEARQSRANETPRS